MFTDTVLVKQRRQRMTEIRRGARLACLGVCFLLTTLGVGLDRALACSGVPGGGALGIPGGGPGSHRTLLGEDEVLLRAPRQDAVLRDLQSDSSGRKIALAFVIRVLYDWHECVFL